MDINQLGQLINKHFKYKRDFIKAFNAQGGDLDETVLSAQLSGRRGISKAWKSAYSIFFTTLISL